MMRPELPDRDTIAELPPDGGPEFNRLVFESSPYLLQHARNPVDWWPWCEEAFEHARREDLPIFLSVGYSTCHWCHVMERESFEDEEIGRILSERFVPIKVDREERPDIDDIYLTATQLMVGRSGWPNSVWLTPDKRPWYSGTYFPPESRGGLPGFGELLKHLAAAWKSQRDEIEARADQLEEAIRNSVRLSETTAVPLTRALHNGAVEALADRFDRRYAGFGGEPKFPPHTALRLLLRRHRTTGDEQALQMALETLDAMARGGLHDHVGGGFHRYCIDAWWLVPHFEKMLYDNGQLARTYAIAHEITGNREYELAARGACDWVLREMTDEAGGFYAALDADSEGEEGRFYLWERDEVLEVIGGEAGTLLCDIFNVQEDGNFADEATGERSGRNILHLSRSGIADGDLWPFVQSAKQQLLEARDARVRPHRDEKVLAAWNGLMIGGLAVAARVFDERAYTRAAVRAADFVLNEMRRGNRLGRAWCDGSIAGPGYLDDYAFMIDGLLDLHQSTGEKHRLEQATGLAEEMLRLFEDRCGGGFFFTAEDDEELFARTKRPFDQSIPSGNGMATLALVRLAARTGDEHYLQAAEGALQIFSNVMQNAPTSTGTLLVATDRYLDLEEADRQNREEEEAALQAPDARAIRGPITVEAWASLRRAAPNTEVQIAVRVTIEDGWHINAHAPGQDNLAGTELSLDAAEERYLLAGVDYPEPETITLKAADEEFAAYLGQIWLHALIAIGPEVEEGSAPLRLSLLAQPCNANECGRPRRYRLELPMLIDREAAEQGRHPEIFDRFNGR